MLKIESLHASVEDQRILKGIDLEVNAGEVHAIMGPNGSGKSTLAHILTGRDGYEITEGKVLFEGRDLSELSPEERAAAGIFLAFQYPVEIPGVGNNYFLKASLNAIRKNRGQDELDAMDFLALSKEKMKMLPGPGGTTSAAPERASAASCSRPTVFPIGPSEPGTGSALSIAHANKTRTGDITRQSDSMQRTTRRRCTRNTTTTSITHTFINWETVGPASVISATAAFRKNAE